MRRPETGVLRSELLVPLLITAALLALAVYESVLQTQLVVGEGRLGDDFGFYRDVAHRWISGAPVYLPHQLAGTYTLTLSEDVLYPPPALLLFTPFLVLPAILWWAIPLSMVGLVFVRHQPVPWTWPILAAILVWPRTIGGILFGNTDMWFAAFMAAGTLWSWPAVLLVLKPTLAPLALVGARHRTWWIGLAGVLLVSVLLLPLVFDYVRAVANLRELPWDYSLLNAPAIVAPLIMRIGRSRHRPRMGAMPEAVSSRQPD